MSAHLPFRRIREALESEVRPLGVSVRTFAVTIPSNDDPPIIVVTFDIDDPTGTPVPQEGLADFDFDGLERDMASDRLTGRTSAALDNIRRFTQGEDDE